MIATLKKKKTTVDLADAYASILASRPAAPASPGTSSRPSTGLRAPTRRSSPRSPSGSRKTKKALTDKDLPAIGATYANALASQHGLEDPRAEDREAALRQGRVHRSARSPPGSFTNGVELYLIPHGKKLYELAFQIDARALASAKLFTSIAQLFRIT